MSTGSPSRTTPRIGIFWCHRGAILARSCEVAEGFESGRFIDSPFDHVSSWERVQRAERSRFPELGIREYQEVPRGRVLYDPRRARFVCYLDQSIDSPETRAALRQAFALYGHPVFFPHDDHYTTDPQALDRLFGN